MAGQLIADGENVDIRKWVIQAQNKLPLGDYLSEIVNTKHGNQTKSSARKERTVEENQRYHREVDTMFENAGKI